MNKTLLTLKKLDTFMIYICTSGGFYRDFIERTLPCSGFLSFTFLQWSIQFYEPNFTCTKTIISWNPGMRIVMHWHTPNVYISDTNPSLIVIAFFIIIPLKNFH